MRKFLLLIILAGSLGLGLAGCATMGAGLFKTEQTWVTYISVNSTPDNADIYINNNLVGKTPAKSLPLMVKYDEYNYGVNIQQVVKEQYVLRVSKRGYKDAAMVIPVKNSGEMYMLGRVEPVGLYQTAFNFNLEPEESAGTRQEKLASSSNTFQPKGTAAELKLGAIIYNSDANQRRVMISDIWYHEGDIFQFFDPKLMVTPKTFKIEEISSNSVKLIDTSSKDGQPITMELKIKE